MLYYAAFTLDVDGGIMITGSHNPADYNGFKMVIQKKSFFGQDIQRLGQLAAAGDFAAGAGAVTVHSVFDAYVNRLLQDYDGQDPPKIRLAAGERAAGPA